MDASMDIITSRKVRDKMKLGHSVEQLVGEKINDYVQIHHLGQKVRERSARSAAIVVCVVLAAG